MKTSKIPSLLVVVATAGAALAAGCELIVDFDRTRIPVPDAGQLPSQDGGTVGEGGASEGGTDAGDPDAAEAGDPDAGDPDAGDGG